MCGIVGGVAERSITNILIEGLKRLEYRGYHARKVRTICFEFITPKRGNLV